MSETPSPVETMPLQNLGADNPEGPSSTSTDTEEVGDHTPFVRRVMTMPQMSAYIRNVIFFILDFIPMPLSVRAYLKVRWFGIFISTVIFLLLVALLTIVLILVQPAPKPVNDPFTDWARNFGPNQSTDTIRLPSSLMAIQYRLFFYFHMNETSERFHYEGRVAINVETTSHFDLVDKFLIHAHKNLDIDFNNFIVTDDTSYAEEMTNHWETFPFIDQRGIMRAEIDGTLSFTPMVPESRRDFGRYEVPNVTRLDDSTLEVKLNREISERSTKLILIRFHGTMRKDPPGIFVNKVPDSDDYWVATHFQPSLARSAFPCFDEPEFRSTFYLSIAHPRKYIALSNMLKSEGRPTSERTGWPTSERTGWEVDTVWSTFAPSIVMPPYLFGFVVGPFKSLLLNRTKNVPETTMFALNQNDLAHRSVFAANITVQAMAFAKEYFQLDYPLGKLHMVALPSKQPIDSECWGLIMAREDEILLDLSTTSVDKLEEVARHVLHYIIHQWIGNIVGPHWWDDLWVIEAVIRYVEDDFLEKIFPEWHVKENFATFVVGEALKVDVMDASHAVASLPRLPYYPMTMFDSLTSIKGAALFRMMDMCTPGSVQKALQRHLRFRAGRTVTADTLFEDLHHAVYYPLNDTDLDGISKSTESEGMPTIIESDGPPTAEVMKKWTRETRFPLVTIVRYSRSSDISVFQETFSPHEMIAQQSLETHQISERNCHRSGHHQRAPGPTAAWLLPIDVWAYNETGLQEIDDFWQTTLYHRVCGGMPPRADYIVVNYNQRGFYRTNYDAGNWQLLGHEMLHSPGMFSKVTRAQLIDDAMAMAKVGRLNFVEALEMPLALMYQGTLGELTAGDVGMYERAMRAVADIHDCLRGSKYEENMLDYMRLFAEALWKTVDPPGRRELEKANGNVKGDILTQRTSILLQEQAIFWGCYTVMTECTEWSITLMREWQKSAQSEEDDALAEHYSNAYCSAVRYGPDEFFDFLWSRFKQGKLSDKHKEEILWSLLCTTQQEKILDVLGGLPGKQALVDDTMELWKRMAGRHVSAWYAFKYERSNWDNMHHSLYNHSFFHQIIVAITNALATPNDLEEIQRFRALHNESLWDIQEMLDESVHNIRSRLFHRSIIEETLKAGLDEIMPLALAVKTATDAARSPSTPSPDFAYTESDHESTTAHPVKFTFPPSHSRSHTG